MRSNIGPFLNKAHLEIIDIVLLAQLFEAYGSTQASGSAANDEHIVLHLVSLDFFAATVS